MRNSKKTSGGLSKNWLAKLTDKVLVKLTNKDAGGNYSASIDVMPGMGNLSFSSCGGCIGN